MNAHPLTTSVSPVPKASTPPLNPHYCCHRMILIPLGVAHLLEPTWCWCLRAALRLLRHWMRHRGASTLQWSGPSRRTRCVCSATGLGAVHAVALHHHAPYPPYDHTRRPPRHAHTASASFPTLQRRAAHGVALVLDI
ncbi:hypothetical protein GGX14DRAFT_397217 [Mycena pura]|uniref:Uncharacterized protein n=1 Tax=Mycena pura TaxID=153505 RepID=A0AAD6YAV9_9AGAR|nr:hypothetical protein GGX14DRAFT_397217 [Mycena pura]